MDEELKETEAENPAQEKSEEKSQEPEKPLDKMTATELRAVAMEIPEITGAHAMKKEELLAAIKEAKGIVDEAPRKKAAGKAKEDLSVKDIKGKITRLKVEKKEARGEQDRQHVRILRRKINRLKKRARKAAQA
jgi:hypothetical protein